jgi:hypothetical protein
MNDPVTENQRALLRARILTRKAELVAKEAKIAELRVEHAALLAATPLPANAAAKGSTASRGASCAY